jgi:hypothetical protein
MIDEFVKAWDARKGEIEAKFRENEPSQYKDIVHAVISILDKTSTYGAPNANNIHEINDGDYQGTLLYLIPEDTYQPHEYWYVRVWYGSCSGCDTLEAIQESKPWSKDREDTKKDERIKDYMTLALHIIQGLKSMDGEGV